MAYKFHSDKKRYFQFQFEHSRDYILPMVSEFLPKSQKLEVMEVGSAEAGVLKAFTDVGHSAVGVEISESRVKNAKKFLEKEISEGKVEFFVDDIHKVGAEKFTKRFDLIIMKDVIEHVYDQQAMLARLQSFLKPEGLIFIGMPPWCMPFGGHQQLLTSKFLNKLPYFHLFPRPIYRGFMKMSGEKKDIIKGLMEVRDTKISINRFKRISKKANLKLVKQQLYFINPNYKYKFGMRPRKQNIVISKIPIFRDFVTTTAYFLLRNGG